MAKIIGNTTATPTPSPKWSQILEKPDVAPALTVRRVGTSLTLDDISPIEHNVKISVKSKNNIPNSIYDLSNWKKTANKTYYFYLIELEAGRRYCLSGYSIATAGNYEYLYLRKSNDNFKTDSTVVTLFQKTVHKNGLTFVAEEGYKYGFCYYGEDANFSQYYNLMLEEGTAISEYHAMVDAEDVLNTTVSLYGAEAYEPMPNNDGTISFPESVVGFPNPWLNVILDRDGVVAVCEYNQDISKAFEEMRQAIISLGGNV